ncbi:MAG: septum formation protein Maf [Elusimicrobia bacterium]|nr:septum formation protein Maf [Elusimicrobiota bacterium]MBU2615304.1 septum formation protein Maf [Elusimicrobiota bacterium]
MRIILCSSSQRRKELVKKFRLPYIVYQPDVDENIKINDPIKLVKKLALLKALDGTKCFSKGLALGVDTIVVLNREIIGKPKNSSDAIRILNKLNGSTHSVYSGFALIDCATGKAVIDYDVTKVKMHRLSRERIKSLSSKHQDKAGAYAVQEKDDCFVEKIYGDYDNVVGLPVKKIKRAIYLKFSV